MQKRRAIALLVETSNAYCRGLLAGILDYAQRQGNWSVVLPEQERGAVPPTWLASWNGDGIIARIETEGIAAALRKMKLPIVDLSAARRIPGIPWAETDDDAITKLAIEHFTERGFVHMAYCGDPGFEWSKRRQVSFCEHARSRGIESFTFESTHRYASNYSVDHVKLQLGKWISKLPRPIAIMACYDQQARMLSDVCRELAISVPEEIAVLGVDNDELLCEFATPPLSSIIPDTKRTGFEAASLLDRMISGQAVEVERLLTRPLGVCTRQSTDILAIEDHEIAVAMRYIREHANHNIRISDVMRQLAMSRRVFESRFRKAVGRTPHQEIQRLRINRVTSLLQQSDLTIAEVAKLAGYEHAEYMAAAFKRETGESPSDYRLRLALGESRLGAGVQE